MKYFHFGKTKKYFLWSAIYCGMLFYYNPLMADSFKGAVTRAIFTTTLIKSEPANEVLVLENNIVDISFFSEIVGMQGKTITHRWEHHGEPVFEKKFQLTEQTEKLVSNYKLSPHRTGEWMVVIADERGWPLKAVMFKYVKKGSFAGKGVVPVR